MADANCACYCDIVQTRSEIVALLAERGQNTAPAPAAGEAEAPPAQQ